MTLSKIFRLSISPTVAFVGAGGKTTALFQLAGELSPALITTTTPLDDRQLSRVDKHFIWQTDAPMPEMESQLGAGLTLVSAEMDRGSYPGLNPGQMEMLHQLASDHALPLLINIDQNSPLPGFVETVVVVAELSGPNQSLADSNLQNIPGQIRKLALLNGADAPELQAQAGQMAGALLSAFETVLVASLEQEKIWSVHEKIAGIILAAGASSRFGRPKQLLDYHGQPFVRKVARTALAAGLSPVIVVSGAYAESIEVVLNDLPIVAIRNREWQNGQASSINAGVNGLPHLVGGAILLLADQPQVTPHVIQALIERRATERAAIVAPLAADRRANPVLFDRSTFGDLLALTGDVGGRAIFSNYKVDYIPWHDESLLFDVDTEDDYRKLLAWGVQD